MFRSRQLFRVIALMVVTLLLSTVSFVQADDDTTPDRPLPDYVLNLKMDAPVETTTAELGIAKIEDVLIGASGPQQVIVLLNGPSVAELAAESGFSQSVQLNAASAISAQQGQVMSAALSLDGDMRVLARTKNVLNAVFLQIDGTALEALAANESVRAIHLVQDYELTLTETVPYIGGTAVQDLGFDGTGISVAVLDSGIDYTHASFGGGGTVADYEAAYGTSPSDPANTTLDGLFPTPKVVGGFDFIGEDWPNTPLAPDPDPIDFQGHGTHVADIIGGVNGVAPGADLYAVKVCSAVASSCSGIALIQAMDFSVDPNGDGNMNDAVDIINMSLGSDYGTAFDDDLSQAVENATAVGVLTVSSAGNGGDFPYKVGTPSSAPSAISVAQTTVPSAFQPLMTVTSPEDIAGDYLPVFQTWSIAPTDSISAPLQYGDGAGGNLDGCNPFAPNSLDGLIVLVDRGGCFFTTKIFNVQNGGGLVGIIGLIAPGAPFSGGYADPGGPITIPGYMISQADSDTLKSGLSEGVNITFDPLAGESLVMHVVGSSSRGPALGSQLIKPEIGAPGGSVSAEVGTGDGVSTFGGTSGASPMVAGSAALLMQAYPNRSWAEIKTVLMNTAETDIINEFALGGGELAPISRIGGGEVRVDRALMSPIAAWDSEDLTGALSFGFHDVRARWTSMEKFVTVKNYTDEAINYHVTHDFRYDNDEATNAVSLYHPSRVIVPANGTAEFKVTLVIRGRQLHDWALNSGSQGNNPAALTLNEFDGYIYLDVRGDSSDDDHPAHIAWHVLPRKASLVYDNPRADGAIRLSNRGYGTAQIESYSLVGESGDLPPAVPGAQAPVTDIRYVGFATYPVPAGFCSANPSFVMALAVNTWEPQTVALFHNVFDFYLDTDGDGTDDYNVFNYALDFGLSDGRSVTWVFDLNTGDATAFFFTDHEMNSGNTVLLFCGEQIGMDATNFFQPIDVDLFGLDGYYGSGVSDAVLDMVISPLGEEYLGIFDDFTSIGFTEIAPKSREDMYILDTGLGITNETGLLLMDRGGSLREAFTIPVP